MAFPVLPPPPPTTPVEVLTRTVWSWLPVTTLPAAARSTVMGFWCAHCTERVSWQLITSSLL